MVLIIQREGGDSEMKSGVDGESKYRNVGEGQRPSKANALTV